MDTDKKICIFTVFDESVGGSVVTGGLDRTLEYLRTYLVEMRDGDEMIFDIQRRDMTEAEIEALPVV